MEVTPEKMEHIRAYQRAYYQEHRDEIKKKAKDYYMRASEGVVSRRNRKFNFVPAEVNGAMKSPDDPKDVIFENLPRKGPGRPPKDPNAPKKPKRDPNEPKRPVGRPRKDRTAEQKNPVGRPRKSNETQPEEVMGRIDIQL